MPKKIVTEDSLVQLVAILNNWQGPLTWELYCADVTRRLGLKSLVTKQTLLRYVVIKKAFGERKAFVRESKSVELSSDSTIEALKASVNNLAEQVRRLSAENELYKEKFVRWQKNIYTHANGFDMAKLESPLVEKHKRNTRG